MNPIRWIRAWIKMLRCPHTNRGGVYGDERLHTGATEYCRDCGRYIR